MKSFEEIKSVYEEEKSGFDVEKEHPEKFIVSLELANLENRNLLKEYNINLKPSDWIVLSIEPEILEKTILRARDLGFLEAYQQTPSFLKQDVDAVIKRILTALGYEVTLNDGVYHVVVPTFRSTGDVSLKDDVMGDIARILSFDSFEAKPIDITIEHSINQRKVLLEKRIIKYLANRCGFYDHKKHMQVHSHNHLQVLRLID